MEPVHTAQILPPRFRSIFLIILPQKDVFLNVFIDLQENANAHSQGFYVRAKDSQPSLLLRHSF